MAKSLDRAQPDMEFLPPHTQGWLLAAVRSLLPLWLRWNCGISKVDTRYGDRLVKLTAEFQAGKVRYILAFRHPTIDDQFAMFHLLSYALPAIGRQMGVHIPNHFYSYYVYDRGIPLWAGEIVTYLYPRTGGIPIHRGKLDRQGLQTIRKFLIAGEYPIAIAPEAGTNGHSEQVASIEPGVAQIGFWGCEDLAAAGRVEQVVIVPIGIQYEYIGDCWEKIDRLLIKIEQECGLSKPAVLPEERYQRLYALGEFLLEFVDKHYKQFYTGYGEITQDLEGEFGDRLQILLDKILRVAETSFGIKGKGSTIDRCRRLEQAGWDRIFRHDFKDLAALSVLERGFADQVAKEANTSHWHLRVAESLTSITGKYVMAHPSPNRFAEVLLIIWRALNRVKSQPFGKLPYLGDRSCLISIGEPISVSDRFSTYQSSRAAAKTCVAQLTSDLQTALESLIEPSALL